MFHLLILSPGVPVPLRAWGMPGVWEWVIVLVIVLVIFGPGKLPMIGEALGKSIKSFKKSVAKEDEIDVTPADQITEGRESNPVKQASREEQQSTVG